jgi:hypothetical protein
LFVYLFIYGLTKLSVTQTVYHQMAGGFVTTESERMGRETVVAKFKALSQHRPRGMATNPMGLRPEND